MFKKVFGKKRGLAQRRRAGTQSDETVYWGRIVCRDKCRMLTPHLGEGKRLTGQDGSLAEEIEGARLLVLPLHILMVVMEYLVQCSKESRCDKEDGKKMSKPSH